MPVIHNMNSGDNTYLPDASNHDFWYRRWSCKVNCSAESIKRLRLTLYRCFNDDEERSDEYQQVVWDYGEPYIDDDDE